LTQQPKEKIIPATRRDAPQGGRHQIGTPAGFGSEKVAGFTLECMAGFVGIGNRRSSAGVKDSNSGIRMLAVYLKWRDN
jgi:hypothetical protein